MMEPVEHEGIGHRGEYREGFYHECEACRFELEALRLRKRNSAPNFNLSWLKTSNLQNHTAESLKKEIYDAARKDGRDITRA